MSDYKEREEETVKTVTNLLITESSDEAFDRFVDQARAQKITVNNYLRRTVRNLLRSGKPRR